MNVLIYYFSGTGNTEKVARLYETALTELGAAVTAAALPLSDEKLSEYNPENFDLIGFGYPIHAFNAPENILKLAKKLPVCRERKRAFIFKSSGEPVRMSDVSSLKLVKLLRKRNIDVKNEYQYCMPYNIIFRHSDEMAYRMWSVTQKLVPADCREIMDGAENRPRPVFMGGMIAGILRVEHWGARVIGRGFKTTSACVNCGMCVRNCPEGNITVTPKGKIKFGKRCMICMRCTFSCPKDAIKPGLLKGWKVNGAYSFAPPDPDKEKKPYKHDKYCKKAYDRYFARAQEKIDKYNSQE